MATARREREQNADSQLERQPLLDTDDSVVETGLFDGLSFPAVPTYTPVINQTLSSSQVRPQIL